MTPDERNAIATFIERYAARFESGPAVREYAFPINRNRHTAEEIAIVKTTCRALAQAVRTGCDEAEHDWPLGPSDAGGDANVAVS